MAASQNGGARLRAFLPVVRFGGMLVAFVLGLIGFQAAFADIGLHPSAVTLITHALRLVVGAFPAPLENRDLPLTLMVARIALPLFTLWSTAALAWLQLRNPIRLALMRARGEHWVIGGDGGLAARVIAHERAARRPVLIWTQDDHAPWIASALDSGAVEASADQSEARDRLALASARGVLIAGPDDAHNVARTAVVIAAADGLRHAGNPLAVIARIDDLDFRHQVEARFEQAPQGAVRLRLASLPDLAARGLFLRWPLDAWQWAGARTRTVFVFGLTPTIERYLVRMLIGGHFRDGIKPRFVIVERDCARVEEDFRARNGQADALSPLVFVTGDFDRPVPAARICAQLEADHGLPVAVLIDAGDDATTLSVAMSIDAMFRARDVPAPLLHVRVATPPAAHLGVVIHAFGALDQFADPDFLIQQDNDGFARSIHEFYLEGRLAEGETIGARASLHEWEDLPERFRDDNRLVADCAQLKLRDIGARLSHGEGPPLRLEAAEMEELARAEHDRWMASKLATGWVHGPVRDDARRIHPDITGYDALSERIKDLDREQIRILTRLLAMMDRRAVRVLTIALLPDGAATLRLDHLLADLAAQYPDRMVVFVAAVDDRAALRALDAVAGPGCLVRLITARHLQQQIDALPGEDAAIAIRLVRGADRIVALMPDAPDDRAWVTDADLVVRGAGKATDDNTITLRADGTVMTAPWRQ